jgi:hypothetical protein
MSALKRAATESIQNKIADILMLQVGLRFLKMVDDRQVPFGKLRVVQWDEELTTPVYHR